MIYLIKKIGQLIAILITLFFLLYQVILPKVLPLDYQELVGQYANQYELDESFVYAVIFCESGFRETIVSHAGAVGLMQVTPTTGDWIKGHLNIETEIDLTNPETNIALGCWYLKWLYEKFDHNWATALAGYNAGQGNVEKWLADELYSLDGSSLFYIPFPETAQYVEKVLFMQKIYHLFYERSFL